MRRFKIIIPLLAIMAGILLIGGCPETDPQGPDRVNQRPIVKFVNIPTEGARFSSDTLVFWYGTDIDGFITMFRYAVVEAALIPDVLDTADYFQTAPDSLIPWVDLTVDLNDPQTNARIKMSADISDPVRTYVSSFVIVQAVDNKGAWSEPIFREYLKNNHFPDTRINARFISDPYVNTTFSNGILPGVSISWTGEDPIDYPRNPPPFEFQWKMFGPYDSTTMFLIESAFIQPVFIDNFGDKYYCRYDSVLDSNICDLYPAEVIVDTILDSSFLPDSLVIDTILHDTNFAYIDTLAFGNVYGKWEELFLIDSFESSQYYSLIESSINPISSDPWVMDINANIYNVYRNQTIDTTTQLNFLFWCQARDDSKVPDPIPARHWVSVIEPRHEREVIVIDATRYGVPSRGFMNWPVYPQSPFPTSTEPMVRDIFAQYVNNWRGSANAFDNVNVLPLYDSTIGSDRCRIRFDRYKATQDYYPIAKLINGNCTSLKIEPVTLRDILKHKVIIIVKDNIGGELIMDSPVMLSVLDGIDAGMSCWSMVRAPFVGVGSTRLPVVGGFFQNIPSSYQLHFGVLNMKFQNWSGAIHFDLNYSGTRIEDFIGTYTLPEFEASLTDLVIDTTLLETRYHWNPGNPGYNFYDYRCGFCLDDPDTGQILLGALPEVGYVERSPFADPIYLYKSLYGQAKPDLARDCCRDVGQWSKDDGAVVAVRLDAGLFRTAHFSFSLLPLEDQQAQQTFNTMMDWLDYDVQGIQAGKITRQAANGVDVNELRRINTRLHEMKAQGLLRNFNDDMDLSD